MICFGAQFTHFVGRIPALAMNIDGDPTQYLSASDVIDYHAPPVSALAAILRGAQPLATAKQCFEYVRDQIKHSGDYRLEPLTCRASDVLDRGFGYCYAKSHLLCALLRANQIPAGLCYQRLSVDGDGPPFCIHGLTAIHLDRIGWYRVDARGNREGVNAQFVPPTEQLAFSSDLPGEFDLPGVYVGPLPDVLFALRTYRTCDELEQNLPDWTDAATTPVGGSQTKS